MEGEQSGTRLNPAVDRLSDWQKERSNSVKQLVTVIEKKDLENTHEIAAKHAHKMAPSR